MSLSVRVGITILELTVITANSALETPTYPERTPDAKAFCEALITDGSTFYHQLLRGNNETAAGRF